MVEFRKFYRKKVYFVIEVDCEKVKVIAELRNSRRKIDITQEIKAEVEIVKNVVRKALENAEIFTRTRGRIGWQSRTGVGASGLYLTLSATIHANDFEERVEERIKHTGFNFQFEIEFKDYCPVIAEVFVETQLTQLINNDICDCLIIERKYIEYFENEKARKQAETIFNDFERYITEKQDLLRKTRKIFDYSGSTLNSVCFIPKI